MQAQDDPQPKISINKVQSQSKPSLRRSDRVRNAPTRYGFVIENNEAHIIENDEPLIYTEAIMRRDSDKWLETMKSEMDSMYSNQVWTLVDALEGVNPIGCKWVFMKNIGADGQVETYKARFVVKGFRQKKEIDYDETFSPIAMLKSIQIMLAIAA